MSGGLGALKGGGSVTSFFCAGVARGCVPGTWGLRDKSVLVGLIGGDSMGCDANVHVITEVSSQQDQGLTLG